MCKTVCDTWNHQWFNQNQMSGVWLQKRPIQIERVGKNSWGWIVSEDFEVQKGQKSS